MLRFLCQIFVILAVSFAAVVQGNDITNCAAQIYKNCRLTDYFMSTLEIIDRELALNRGKADEYFLRQVCKNSNVDLDHFHQCVVSQAGSHCWRWDGVFDSIRLVGGPGTEVDMLPIAKRYEQVFVIIHYDLCQTDFYRNEYLDIRACSHKRHLMPEEGGVFHERFSRCLTSKEPNDIQLAMNKMDLCVGHNHEYSCFVDTMLGQHCDKVKTALLKYADAHAGHAGLHEDELRQMQFVLQAAYTDNLRIPKPQECYLLERRSRSGANAIPTTVYMALMLLCAGLIGYLLYRFKDEISYQFQRVVLPK